MSCRACMRACAGSGCKVRVGANSGSGSSLFPFPPRGFPCSLLRSCESTRVQVSPAEIELKSKTDRSDVDVSSKCSQRELEVKSACTRIDIEVTSK